DGAATPMIAADVAIADGESHVYRVSVVIAVDEAAITGSNSDCDIAAGEDGSGLTNTATVMSNDSSSSATACEPVAGIVIAKSVTAGPTSVSGGRYQIDYTITVTNRGAGAGSYDLADRFH